MQIGPNNPGKDSPEMAGSQKHLDRLIDATVTRAEIGRLADLARRTDRVELSATRETERTDEIYSRREIEETHSSRETGQLSEKRRQEIREKIESGFYQSEEVKSKIIDKILGDTDNNSIEG